MSESIEDIVDSIIDKLNQLKNAKYAEKKVVYFDFSRLRELDKVRDKKYIKISIECVDDAKHIIKLCESKAYFKTDLYHIEYDEKDENRIYIRANEIDWKDRFVDKWSKIPIIGAFIYFL